MSGSHKWAPITDLPDDSNSLTEGELRSLQRVWQRQKQELVDHGVLDEFDRRLRREWSIETGIIENVYTLDRGVTRTLIERGIDAALIPHGASDTDSTRVARIIQDHYETLEGMFDFVGGQRQLTAGYVKGIHAALLRNQDTYSVVDQFGQAFEKRLEKGIYKTAPNSPTRPDGSVHEYCPPEHVASEMDRLVEMHVEHEARRVPPEVEAAWLHHRFAQIHPFADGNGRVARALASLVFIKAGWFPLVVKRDDWTRYIDALEKADKCDLKPLVSLFVEAQRTALIEAGNIAVEAVPITNADDAIAAVRDRVIQRGRLSPPEWLESKKTAGALADFARERFGQVSTRLSQEIGNLGRGFSFDVGEQTEIKPDDAREAMLREQGHTIAPAVYNRSIVLALQSGRNHALVLSFHALGPRFRGLIGVIAYFLAEYKPVLLKVGDFQINYEEPLDSAKTRFSNWLERVIVAGLDRWRRTL